MVPPLARSKAPGRDAIAPVNEPFSWPNSSLSIRFGGIAPQSSTTIGPRLRPESSWMARATNSLPVPVSPWMITETSIGAIFLMSPKICRIFTDWPIIPHSSPSRSGSTVTSSSMGAKLSVVCPARTWLPCER